MGNFFFWLWFDEFVKKHPWMGLFIALSLLLLFATGTYLPYQWSAGFLVVAVCGIATVVEMAAIRTHMLRILRPRHRSR